MLLEVIEIVKWLWPVSWLLIVSRYYYEVIRDKDWEWMEKADWGFAILLPIFLTFFLSVAAAILLVLFGAKT